MVDRIAFMASGATLARLQPRNTADQGKESTRRCLAHLDIGSEDGRDFSDPASLVPIDLELQAGRAAWDAIEHDSWGRQATLHPVTQTRIFQSLSYLPHLSSPSAGAHVTTFGGDKWPLAATANGVIYLRTHHFWRHRAAIERNARWPGRYKACELVSLQYAARYPDGARYVGFFGELIENVSATRAVVRVFRADGVVAGEWGFRFGPGEAGEEVDSTVTVQVLNEDPRVEKSLPAIERPLAVGDIPGTRGAIFLNLNRAAELWDRSELQNGYGLAGPKLPFWLD